ncbi:MAG TPA: UDP-N-acetylmuramoyl-tripeptide--D-alanyl-D-alanine ligase [Ktedonobacterales bacterium]|jgi:UDP-N-acetylmuramoyl-tripeptide--D-alanyl-D-alanine ligase
MFTRDELLVAAHVKPRDGILPMRMPGAAVDSRLVQPGELFVALRGAQTDGHQFIAAAVAAGASAILCSAPDDTAAAHHIAQLVVPDPLATLQQLAHARLTRQPQTRVIGITGSSGKTSTKEATAALLAHLAPTLKTRASFNTETGLPLTILRLEPEHRFAVLEMGAQWVGEIAMLCRIAPPQIGIITTVGPAHLEYFGSIENVERAKGELVAALPADGIAIINADDRRVRRMDRRTKARVITYGRRVGADVRALRVGGDPLQGLRFTLTYDDQHARVHLNLPGEHAVSTALAAAAAALACGLSIEAAAAGLGELRPAKRRGEIKSGPNGATLVDDSYNANRQSVEAALRLIHSAKLPRGAHRWAILGDMFELGAHAAAEHALVGALAAELVDELVAIGAEACHVAEAALAAGMGADHVHLFTADVADASDRARALREAAALVRERARHSDLILVKGSLGMGMDAIVSALHVQEVSPPAATWEISARPRNARRAPEYARTRR